MNVNVDGFRGVHARSRLFPNQSRYFVPRQRVRAPFTRRSRVYIHIHGSVLVYYGLQRRTDVCSRCPRTMESRIWSNEIEMLFLEHYQSETILWDAKHLHHKDKKKHHDAWNRISSEMGIEIKELKKKKDSLLSSYRLYRKKVCYFEYLIIVCLIIYVGMYMVQLKPVFS